jgi:hypothetical protein
MRRLVVLVMVALALGGCSTATPRASAPTTTENVGPPSIGSQVAPSSEEEFVVSSGGVPLGMLNHDVTQRTIGTTICKTGWTATIRPPESYTAGIKSAMDSAYHFDPKASAETDHVIPLELGGSPTAHANLYPEPKAVALKDDQEENRLRRAVCDGSMKLAEARHSMIVTKTAHGYDSQVRY